MDLAWKLPAAKDYSDPATSGTQDTAATAATATGAPPGVPTNAQGNYNGPIPPTNSSGGSWHRSGTANQWVDNSYQLDANGNPLSAADQARWRLYDQNRASSTAAHGGGHTDTSHSDGGPGVDAPIYDAETKTYSYKDKDGVFHHGNSVNDIYGLLNKKVQEQYPEFYFGQYAKQQDAGHRSSLDAQAYDNQTFAIRGGQTTRYSATNF